MFLHSPHKNKKFIFNFLKQRKYIRRSNNMQIFEVNKKKKFSSVLSFCFLSQENRKAISKNIFTYLFSVHNTVSLSRLK